MANQESIVEIEKRVYSEGQTAAVIIISIGLFVAIVVATCALCWNHK